MPLPSDPDCYWVEPGRVMAGEYPGDWSERSARRKLRALLDAGVRTFVDLTEHGELEPYDDWLAKEATAAGVEVDYHRHSIRDLDVPTADGMRAILDLIESAITAEAPVYVHCWGGIGRRHGGVLLAGGARPERRAGAGGDRGAAGRHQEAADQIARDAGTARLCQNLAH
ncbi:MAG: hypothetical protein JJE40_08485 [Vicinamibacteria bacterium]|nr:hypothetical protein [Vicinamibacteria bacterium]